MSPYKRDFLDASAYAALPHVARMLSANVVPRSLPCQDDQPEHSRREHSFGAFIIAANYVAEWLTSERASVSDDWKCDVVRLVDATSRQGVMREAVDSYEEALDQYWMTFQDEHVAARTMLASPAPDDALRQTFLELAEEWRGDTKVLSSIPGKAMHWAYQRIIGMGEPALPLILRELERKPDHWFWALTAITGQDPVPPEDAGNIRKMTEAWLRLGRQRGLL